MFEIRKVNCPKWNNEFEPKKLMRNSLFLHTAFWVNSFETVAFARWNFFLLIQLKDNKKFQRAFKMHCNFHDAINAVAFPLKPTKNLFSVTQKTFVSPKRNWKQYKFVGNKNCIMDSYKEHRQQCTLFTPPQILHSHFFHFSPDDCNTLGKLELRSSDELVEMCPCVADRIGIW